ncbi:MAG: septum site-determining protein Ssd [Marmoricola sp.]
MHEEHDEPVSGGAGPLLVTGDDLLAAEVLRLGAAAGVTPEVVHDPATALRRWTAPPLVLVGTDLLGTMAACHPPRRGRVHVLGHGPVADLAFRDALAVSAESVAELPTSQGWLVEMLTDAGDGRGVPGASFGVLGGAGGVGATVFAAALARVSARSAETLLVDADPLGAGIERVLGMERIDGVRWDAMLHATGRLSARSLREALPRRQGLSVLAWPADRAAGPCAMQAFAARELFSAGRRGFDQVVWDLPRHPDPVVDELLARCDGVVLVSTLTVPAVTAAARVAARLPGDVPARLVTRGSGGGVTPQEVSRLLGVPLACAMPSQRNLDESVDLGAGPVRSHRGALARAARQVLERLRDREARAA